MPSSGPTKEDARRHIERVRALRNAWTRYYSDLKLGARKRETLIYRRVLRGTMPPA